MHVVHAEVARYINTGSALKNLYHPRSDSSPVLRALRRKFEYSITHFCNQVFYLLNHKLSRLLGTKKECDGRRRIQRTWPWPYWPFIIIGDHNSKVNTKTSCLLHEIRFPLDINLVSDDASFQDKVCQQMQDLYFIHCSGP